MSCLACRYPKAGRGYFHTCGKDPEDGDCGAPGITPGSTCAMARPCPAHPAPAEHPILHAARLACAALTQALDTERECANEVEARGGERRARLMLATDRQSAGVALGALAMMLPPHRVSEVAEMADGATRGYARASWTLRVMQIAAEVARGNLAD